jgi:hypothetical protein
MEDIIKSEFIYHEPTGELTHKTTQPTESIILDRNSELRKNSGVIRDLGDAQSGGTWGRQVASIPFIVYEKAIRDGFFLNSKDQKFAGLEMNRFLQSAEGKACLVRG